MQEMNAYPRNIVRETVAILGRGVGQVMFQNNALSGFLMLIGLACGSFQAAALALLGNVVSTATARVLRCDTYDIRNGLYGFNGTLVGIAMGVCFETNVWIVAYLFVGAVLSTILFRYWPARRLFPPVTAPFVLVTWALFGISYAWYPQLLARHGVPSFESNVDFFASFCRSFGQVMFQGDTNWAGLLFLAGILINSRRQAFAAIAAVLFIMIVSVVPADLNSAFNTGMFGYNAVLCAMVFSMDNFYHTMLSILSVSFSSILQLLGIRFGIPTLTAPFVIATWVVMVIDALCCKIYPELRQ